MLRKSISLCFVTAGLPQLLSAAFLSAVQIALGALLFTATGSSQVSSLTQHNDNFRTGANLSETILNTSNVNPNQFGKLFTRRVDGQLYAQPLYVSAVTVPGKGTHNIVYLATEHNSVYAFDADNPKASAPLWQVNLGAPVYFKEVSLDINLRPEMGITGTPVIDAATKTMYLVAYTSQAGSQLYYLHALDITTGMEKLNGPTLINGSSKGTGADSTGGTINFNSSRQLQRPAMLLLNGILHIAFGSHADRPNYHGWVFTYSASTLQQLGVYNTTPSGDSGAIWQSGQGLTADEQGFSYFMTGNGTSTPDGVNISEAFGKLLAGQTISLVDWFMVSNANSLNSVDEDLGSGGVLHIPGSQRIIGGGKQGVLYVVDTANLGHFSQPVQTLPVCFNGHIHGSPVYWNSPATGPRVYFWCENDFLQAFNFVNGALNTTRADVSTVQAAVTSMPGGMLSISANGGAAGSGIVWAAIPFNADSIHQTVSGTLRAFNAANLSSEIWNSKQNDTRDDVGDFAKFNPPLIANGKVYLATFSGQLVVYGLLPAPAGQPDMYAINAGGGAEGTFQADSKFSGGVTAASGFSETSYVDPKAVANPAPQMVYRTARQGAFTYNLSGLTSGTTYAIRLQFAEFQFSSGGQRRFNVAINGTQVLTNFDIYAAAGAMNVGIDQVFTAVPNAGGGITVQFTNGSVGNAQVNGIEIAPIGAASATFINVDSTTQGAWRPAYGANGYNLVGDASAYPAYAQVSVTAANQAVWSASTTDIRALKKLAPATDRIASTWWANTNFVVDVNLTDSAIHKVSMYLLDWDSGDKRAVNIDIVDAVSGTVLDGRVVTSFSGGKYLSWNLKGHVQIRCAAMNDGGNAVLSGLFFDPPSSVGSGGGSASFVSTDTATQGNWKKAYGAGGYEVINDSRSFPASAQMSASGASSFTWSNSTVDPRGLQKGATGASDRIAATWYSNGHVSIALNLSDGLTHQLALYFLDWDNQQRSLKVDILDAASKSVLDTQNVSSFSGGKYLVWRAKGNIVIDISSATSSTMANAVISGLFLDGPAVPAGPPSQSQATFVAKDTSTGGTWNGAYGTDGYNIINGSVSYPAYAQVSATSQQAYTWAASTTEIRALQNPVAGPGPRLAACWFNQSSFVTDVNLTDGTTRNVSLYFLDWDNKGRSEKVELLDYNTGAVLDTQAISAFANGAYLTWKITGHVKVRITSLVAQNAVLSGIFFGQGKVSFVARDTSTGGTWSGAYGTDGYNIINGSVSYPAYAQVSSATTQQSYTWAASTADIRALQNPAAGAGARLAACGFNQTGLMIDVNLTDAATHNVSLYFLDWDNNGRSEKVELLDYDTGAVLDTQDMSAFKDGVYLTWKITGHVKFRITSLGSQNAVLSGIFFR